MSVPRLFVPLVAVSFFACATPKAPDPIADKTMLRCDDPTSYRSTEVESALETARRYIEACATTNTSSLTATLVRYPTVRANEDKDGPSFVRMRTYLEHWSRRAGLHFESFDDDPWVISWGEGEPSVAFVMHADVVPVDPTAWSVPPFEVTDKDGRLYGRGTEDDKGPIAAVLHTIDTLKKLGHQPKGRVLAILGTGEEHSWDGMVAYTKAQPHAKFVVSIDANFPVVVAESGFVAWRLEAPLASKSRRKKGCLEAVDVRAGQFLTQVPGEAHLDFKNLPAAAQKKIESRAAKIAERKHVTYTFNTKDKRSTLTMSGRAVHSSVADEGTNALWALAAAVDDLNLCPSGIRDTLSVVARYFDQDLWGEKLGLAYSHPMMGKLLVVPTILGVEDGRVTLSINMRRPEGRSAEEFGAGLDRALQSIQKNVSKTIVEKKDGRYVGQPAVADTDGPLVDMLLGLYRTAANDPNAKPLSIRGGTYARLFPGAVSFGPSIPGREYRGHAPDEYLETEALELMNKTILEAMVRLDELAMSP